MLEYRDHRHNPEAWAQHLGIDPDAVRLYLDSEVIDLHTDSYIWKRVAGYRLEQHHRLKPWLKRWGAPFAGQVDFPRCLEAQMAGLVWDIPTHPLRRTAEKHGRLRENIAMILADLKRHSAQFEHVVSYADYRRARAAGKVASWISIQGGQALDHNLHDLARIPEVHRITLVHFTRSRIGASNFDKLHAHEGLSSFGKAFVERMVEFKMLVDLAHINRRGFFDALDVMPADVPPIVTHTGVKGVYDIWRNIDDAQIRAVAERGGTIGAIYEANFLSQRRAGQSVAGIVDHLAHIIQIGGEDAASLGSDYDGLIRLPKDLPDITYQPRLVAEMSKRGWSETRIRKILGLNFLRVVQAVRPD